MVESRQSVLILTGVITYAAATIVVCLRLLARRIQQLSLWWDDYLCLLAFLNATGFSVGYFVWIKNGMGLHHQDVSPDYNRVFSVIMQHLLVDELFYATALGLSKLSILAFYWRIFNIPSIRWPIRVVSAIVLGWMISRVVSSFLHCVPLAGYWDRTVKAHCGVNTRKFFLSTTSLNFVLDSIVLTMPLPFIRRLHLPLIQKVVVGCMFLFGGFICITSIVLIVVIKQFDETNPDISWTIAPIALWAVSEVNLALVSVCLPSLRPILTLFSKRRATSRQSKFAYSYQKGSKQTYRKNSLPLTAVKGADSESKHPFATLNQEESETNVDLENTTAFRNDTTVTSDADLIAPQPVYDQDRGIMVKHEFSVQLRDRDARVTPVE